MKAIAKDKKDNITVIYLVRANTLAYFGPSLGKQGRKFSNFDTWRLL
jgi:hypothetical protein